MVHSMDLILNLFIQDLNEWRLGEEGKHQRSVDSIVWTP